MKSLLGRVRRSDVIFRANGHFDLTARVVSALNISPGDVVDILSDGCEYYLYVAFHSDLTSCGRYEARVYPSNRKGGGRHYRGSSARLCKAVLNACNATDKVALPCGEIIIDNGRKLLPIIVRLNLSRNS